MMLQCERGRLTGQWCSVKGHHTVEHIGTVLLIGERHHRWPNACEPDDRSMSWLCRLEKIEVCLVGDERYGVYDMVVGLAGEAAARGCCPTTGWRCEDTFPGTKLVHNRCWGKGTEVKLPGFEIVWKCGHFVSHRCDVVVPWRRTILHVINEFRDEILNNVGIQITVVFKGYNEPSFLGMRRGKAYVTSLQHKIPYKSASRQG